jgi:pilus assembly protein CpaC
LQHRVEANNRGIPVLADLPWVGAAFRRVEEQINEIELLVLVTPQLVDALDSEQVPPGGPGMFTTSPCDTDFYWRGHIEVPRYSIQAGVYGDQVYDHAAEQVPAVPKSESQTSVSQRPQQREPHGQRAGATEPAAVVAVRAPQAADRTTGTARDAAPLPEPRGTGQTGAPHESSMVTAIDVPGARPQPSRGSVPGLIGPVGFELME